jgi:hypothetical protein
MLLGVLEDAGRRDVVDLEGRVRDAELPGQELL